MYWQLKDIPELRGVPVAQRRRLWREAVTRSFSVRYFLLRLATGMLAGVAFATLGYVLWPAFPVWLMCAFAGVACAGVIFAIRVTQPRARRWLHDHADELDRYVSA